MLLSYIQFDFPNSCVITLTIYRQQRKTSFSIQFQLKNVSHLGGDCVLVFLLGMQKSYIFAACIQGQDSHTNSQALCIRDTFQVKN